MTHNDKNTLTGIQYLRGFAALMVVVCHASTMFSLEKYFGFTAYKGFLESGSKGVELFFVLSGYIIAYTTLNSDLAPKTSIKSFARRRAFRLLPLMWISVFGYLVLRTVMVGPQDLGPYIRAATLYPVGSVSPNVIWTLRHEFLFYLIVGASFALGKHWKYTTFAWVLSPLLYLAIGGDGSGVWALVFSKLNLLFGFGMCIAFLDLKGKFSVSVPNRSAIVVLTVACMAIMLLDYGLGHLQGDSSSNTPTVLSCLVLGLACSIVLILARCLGNAKPRWGLEAIVFQLGEASYSIYLFHEMFLSFSLGQFAKRFGSASPAVAIFGSALFAVVGTYVIYWLIERPLLRYLRDLKKSTTVPVVEVEAMGSQ